MWCGMWCMIYKSICTNPQYSPVVQVKIQWCKAKSPMWAKHYTLHITHNVHYYKKVAAVYFCVAIYIYLHTVLYIQLQVLYFDGLARQVQTSLAFEIPHVCNSSVSRHNYMPTKRGLWKFLWHQQQANISHKITRVCWKRPLVSPTPYHTL